MQLCLDKDQLLLICHYSKIFPSLILVSVCKSFESVALSRWFSNNQSTWNGWYTLQHTRNSSILMTSQLILSLNCKYTLQQPRNSSIAMTSQNNNSILHMCISKLIFLALSDKNWNNFDMWHHKTRIKKMIFNPIVQGFWM